LNAPDTFFKRDFGDCGRNPNTYPESQSRDFDYKSGLVTGWKQVGSIASPIVPCYRGRMPKESSVENVAPMPLRMGQAATIAAIVVSLLFISSASLSQTTENLPAQLSDSEFWKMVSEFSEPHGFYQYNVVTSNEVSYQYVVPNLIKRGRFGGVYLGVGPEQNFTYIAAIQPKIAFIFDIRRDMLFIHLMYKSIFEMSADRVEFVSNLFSRKAPAHLTADSSVQDIFQAFAKSPADTTLAADRLKQILNRLKTVHRFALTAQDEEGIRSIYMTFVREGVVYFDSSFLSPGYARLMLLTDLAGKNWSFLASRENYDRIRAMQQKNLIVPLVGDFGGPKAIRAVGQYLKDRGATVNAFYISNVEDYIGGKWPQYISNLGSLPVEPSSTFIRWYIGGSPTLGSIAEFVRSSQRVRE